MGLSVNVVSTDSFLLSYFFYIFIFKRNLFRLDLEERLEASRTDLGTEFQATGPMDKITRFPYLLSLMRETILRPASAQCGEREG